MNNFKVYKKTLLFSLIQFCADIFSLMLVAGSVTAGFFIANGSTSRALIGLFVGLLIGILLAVLFEIFVTNRIKAAQISMMVKGVTEGDLPEHSVKAGFNEIKGRFGKITVFFVITNMIKGVFRQVGRGINRLATAVGGDVGNGISSAIDTAIQILIGYLCDCCLGWILYRKEENAFKAGCEGAVIFFKHGKTLIRNIGRIFGLGLLSLLVIGGGFMGIFYLVFTQFPNMFVTLASEISEAATRAEWTDMPAWLADPKILIIVTSAIAAIVIWGVIHSVLVRPFILVGVLRNFMDAGQKESITEKDLADLEAESPKFKKMMSKAQE